MRTPTIAVCALACVTALSPAPVRSAVPELDRRAALGALLSSSLAAVVAARPTAAIAVGNVNEISLGSGVTGNSQADLGIVLLDEVKAAKSVLTANLLLDGAPRALALTARFDAGEGFALAKGGFYDVEARNKDQDNCFLQAAPARGGEGVAALPAKFFADALFKLDGRFGTFGAPIDVKNVGDALAPDGRTRFLEFAFASFTASGAEVPRRVAVAAARPDGAADVLMVVSGCSAPRWKKGGDAVARAAARSLTIVSARPADVAKSPEADYRFGKPVGPDLRGSLSKPTAVYDFGN